MILLNSRQFSINTEARGNIAVDCIDKRPVCTSHADSNILKVEEQAILREKVIELDFDL